MDDLQGYINYCINKLICSFKHKQTILKKNHIEPKDIIKLNHINNVINSILYNCDQLNIKSKVVQGFTHWRLKDNINIY